MCPGAVKASCFPGPGGPWSPPGRPGFGPDPLSPVGRPGFGPGAGSGELGFGGRGKLLGSVKKLLIGKLFLRHDY